MVSLAPPLKAVLEIRLLIESGNSVSQSIQMYSQSKDLFAKEIGVWLFSKSTGREYQNKIFNTFYRKKLLEILTYGLKGEPILSALSDLEKDLVFMCHENLEQHIQKLPFICLIPLLLFQFPAFFMLLVGPLLLNLLNSLQN
ncbi:MAG: hypothetical protein GDA46_01235 [Bdellovibrionales bacterium]|nr:hypothetical protein [Bdellovibrionales bacterium]